MARIESRNLVHGNDCKESLRGNAEIIANEACPVQRSDSRAAGCNGMHRCTTMRIGQVEGERSHGCAIDHCVLGPVST